MRKILIFDTKISGHHLEYIHHLSEYANSLKDTQIIFAIPEAFNEKKMLFEWNNNTNVSYRFLTEKELKQQGGLKGSLNDTILLRKICKEVNPSETILIMLMAFLPFLPFLIRTKTKVSGIIYKIYLYEWKSKSFLGKVLDVLKYYLLTSLSTFDKIFILNDAASVRRLNQIWHSNRFKYLPDPYVPLDENKIKNIRSELNISPDRIILSHIGAMARRKGTLTIFKCIERLTAVELQKYCFVFAGRVYDDIKEQFYKEVQNNKDKVQILVFDEFCSYDFIGDLCSISNYLLLPYSETSQSSGVIAYGSQFKTPVIVPNKGLLGKLVRKYHLGYALKNNFIDAFLEKTEEFDKKEYQSSDEYVHMHTVYDFAKLLLEA